MSLAVIAAATGCSGSAKVTAAATPSVTPTQVESSPSSTPGSAYGAAVTITSATGYVYKVQTYAGSPVTSVDVNGTTENAPPGTVIPVFYVNITDGLTDRAEPLDLVTGDSTNGANLRMALPAADAAAFGRGNAICVHGVGVEPTSGPDRWCDIDTFVTQESPEPDLINPQLQPGVAVSMVLVAAHPVPQGAPISDIRLFSEINVKNPIEIPMPHQ